MYSDENLKKAVEKGIFSQEAVDKFKTLIDKSKSNLSKEGENFRLVTDFNDIFVLVASLLFMISLTWLTSLISTSLSFFIMSALSILLSMHFVRKHRMALPGIVLFLAYSVANFLAVLSIFGDIPSYYPDDMLDLPGIVVALILTTVLCYPHWKYFKVPITIASSYLISTLLFMYIAGYVYELGDLFVLNVLAVCGMIMLVSALYWDYKDKKRVSMESDVAFWLHLGAAFCLVISVFHQSVILYAIDLALVLFVTFLYVVISVFAIIVDRRAFMVSSLGYVLYTVTDLVTNAYGEVISKGIGFSIIGLIMGGSLVTLSIYWRGVRRYVFKFLPQNITKFVAQIR